MSDRHPSQETLHDERIIAVREEPILHFGPYQRDVTNVKRSGEWLNMESKNLEPGRTLTLRFVMLSVRSLSRSTERCSDPWCEP